MLALASIFCYDKRVFRAGCNSRPAVTLTSYFGLLVVVLSRYTLVLFSTATPRLIPNILVKEVRERELMWCDSTTDSIVWMGEDERIILSIPLKYIGSSFGVLTNRLFLI